MPYQNNRQYEDNVIGKISLGPAASQVITLTKHRDYNGRLVVNCDLRLYKFSAKKRKFYATKAGTSIPMHMLLPIIKKIEALPVDEPKITEMTELLRIPKSKMFDIVLSLANHDGELKIDIREWCNISANDYVGFTQKGVRFFYGIRGDLANLLTEAYEDMLLIENKVRDGDL
jgi:hypothetical protein